MFLARLTARPLVGLTQAAGVLLLLASASQPWWRLIETPEPGYVKAARAAAAVLAFVVLAAWLAPRFRTGILLGAGSAALILPLFVVMYIVAMDPASMGGAYQQDTQLNRLSGSIDATDLNPQIPWTEDRQVRDRGGLHNEYSLTEASETVSFYTKTGWYLCFTAGLLLFTVAWVWDGSGSRRIFARGAVWAAAGLVVVVAVFYGPKALANYRWNQGRAAAADGDDRAALADFQEAERLDPRFRYDMLFHFDIGRLYGRLGRRTEPDYWAYVGDLYYNAGAARMAYVIYHDHIADMNANPTIARRYHDLLIQNASDRYTRGRTNEAIALWRQAGQIDPRDVQTMYALGMSYAKIGEYREAIPIWRKLIEDNESVGMFKAKYYAERVYHKPITARAWSNLAWCYYGLHRYDLAMQCNQNAVKQGKTDTTFLE